MIKVLITQYETSTEERIGRPGSSFLWKTGVELGLEGHVYRKRVWKEDEGRKWLRIFKFPTVECWWGAGGGKKQAVALSNSCIYCCCNTCWFL